MAVSQTQPTCLVYRDRLLPPSEHNFIQAQYSNFSHLRPFYVGRYCDHPPSFMHERYFIGTPGPVGWPRRTLFKLFGIGGDHIVSKHSPSIIHAQFLTSAFLALPLARRFHLPFVVTCHGADIFKKSHDHANKGGKFLDLIKYVDRFIAVSFCVRDRLIQLGVPADRISYVPIGVPDRGQTANNAPSHSLLMASRFTAKKGHGLLLDALSLLQRKGISPHVIIAGEGPLRQKIISDARRLKLGNVQFTGWLDQKRLGEAFTKVRALISPSIIAPNGDREGWATITKEALMAGVPVIATRATDIPPIAAKESASLEIKDNDPHALADAIEKMLEEKDELYLQRARLARNYAVNHLLDKTLSARLERILIDVIKNRRGKVKQHLEKVRHDYER